VVSYQIYDDVNNFVKNNFSFLIGFMFYLRSFGEFLLLATFIHDRLTATSANYVIW